VKIKEIYRELKLKKSEDAVKKAMLLLEEHWPSLKEVEFILPQHQKIPQDKWVVDDNGNAITYTNIWWHGMLSKIQFQITYYPKSKSFDVTILDNYYLSGDLNVSKSLIELVYKFNKGVGYKVQ